MLKEKSTTSLSKHRSTWLCLFYSFTRWLLQRCNQAAKPRCIKTCKMLLNSFIIFAFLNKLNARPCKDNPLSLTVVSVAQAKFSIAFFRSLVRELRLQGALPLIFLQLKLLRLLILRCDTFLTLHGKTHQLSQVEQVM